MSTKIEWCDETINPIKEKGGGYHCTKIRPGCARCYAERINMSDYYKIGNGKPFDDRDVEFEIDFASLNKILRNHKSPKKYFVQSMGDIFHRCVSFDLVDKIWDTIWKSPNTAIVITKRIKRMHEYITKRAYAKHFGWTDEERVPFKPGDLIHIDDLWMRNMCGWTAPGKCDCNSGYICDYPENEHAEKCEHGNRLCFSWNCPIAYDDPLEEVLEANGMGGQYDIDDEGISIDCDWMQLHTRPKDAFVENLWIGATIENQEEANKCISVLLQTPATIRLISVEPMLEKINIKPWIDKLDWVICGPETGPGVRKMKIDWIAGLYDQCKTAGVPFFDKKNVLGLGLQQFPEVKL